MFFSCSNVLKICIGATELKCCMLKNVVGFSDFYAILRQARVISDYNFLAKPLLVFFYICPLDSLKIKTLYNSSFWQSVACIFMQFQHLWPLQANHMTVSLFWMFLVNKETSKDWKCLFHQSSFHWQNWAFNKKYLDLWSTQVTAEEKKKSKSWSCHLLVYLFLFLFGTKHH